jgi:hypothetical protein
MKFLSVVNVFSLVLATWPAVESHLWYFGWEEGRSKGTRPQTGGGMICVTKGNMYMFD